MFIPNKRKEQWPTYAMKMSATMFMPRNIQMREARYIMASMTGDIVEIPGKSTQLFQIKYMLQILKWSHFNGRSTSAICLILPVAELFEICVFDDTTAREVCNRQFFVFLTIVVKFCEHDACLD